MKGKLTGHNGLMRNKKGVLFGLGLLAGGARFAGEKRHTRRNKAQNERMIERHGAGLQRESESGRGERRTLAY
jgi:hypothetical protein